jgi:hypothetical protein
LRSRAAPELGNCVGRRQCSAVGAIRCHRVEGITHGDDARTDRDFVLAQAVGIALAVEALVARADQPRDPREGWGGAHDALSDQGVVVHERPLALIERSRLPQNALRDRDLADVVQLRGVRDLLDQVRSQPDPASDVLCEGRDGIDV